MHPPPRSRRAPAGSQRSPRPVRGPSASLEEALRLALREGLQQQLAPVRAQLDGLSTALGGLTALTALACAVGRLRAHLAAPVTRPVPAPVSRPRAPVKSRAKAAACALIGCARAARSLGYCAPHEQKRRLLEARGLLPERWVKGASPGTLADVHLPRGRRPGHEEAPVLTSPTVPSGPRAWVRRKGEQLQPLAPLSVTPAPHTGAAA